MPARPPTRRPINQPAACGRRQPPLKKGLKREIQIAKAAALVTVEQVKEAEKQEEKPRKKEPKPLASPPSMDSSDFIALGLPAPSQVDVVSTVTSSSAPLASDLGERQPSGVRDADGRLAREDDVTLAPGQPDTRLVDARQPIGHRGGRNRHPEAGRDGDQVLQAWQVAPRKVHTRGG